MRIRPLNSIKIVSKVGDLSSTIAMTAHCFDALSQVRAIGHCVIGQERDILCPISMVNYIYIYINFSFHIFSHFCTQYSAFKLCENIPHFSSQVWHSNIEWWETLYFQFEKQIMMKLTVLQKINTQHFVAAGCNPIHLILDIKLCLFVIGRWHSVQISKSLIGMWACTWYET